MADLACWYKTQLPSDTLLEFNNDMNSRDTVSILNRSTVVDEEKSSNRNVRKSKNFWISTNHWIGGWIWFYIQKLNRENFKYDIIDIVKNEWRNLPNIKLNLSKIEDFEYSLQDMWLKLLLE